MSDRAFVLEAADDEREGVPLRGRVLVVDDERNIRRVLRLVLESEGAEVLEAALA